jgi:hypothetical protein
MRGAPGRGLLRQSFEMERRLAEVLQTQRVIAVNP